MELLSDRTGSISFGWVAPGVYLCRMSGVISDSLGVAHANRLQAILEDVDDVRYFGDSRAVTSYDLVGRSALVRSLVANRDKLEQVVMLTWSEGSSTASQAFTAALGEPVVILTNPSEFDRRLSLAAPHAPSAAAAQAPDLLRGRHTDGG